MARFYGEIRGNRGSATRMGTKKSGFTAHIRGWDVGVQIEMFVTSDDIDTIRVYRTSGSSGGEKKLIRVLTAE